MTELDDVSWRGVCSGDVIDAVSLLPSSSIVSRASSRRDLKIPPLKEHVAGWLESILGLDSCTGRFAYPSSGGFGHVGALALGPGSDDDYVPYVYISGTGLLRLESIGIEHALVKWAASKVTLELPPWVIFLYSDLGMLRQKYSGNLAIAAAVEVGCVVQLAYERARLWGLALCASGSVRGKSVELFRDKTAGEELRLMHLATLLVASDT